MSRRFIMKRKKSFYVVRNKLGQIRAFHNIGRSTRQDALVRARRTVHKRGQGHLGDYPSEKDWIRDLVGEEEYTKDIKYKRKRKR